MTKRSLLIGAPAVILLVLFAQAAAAQSDVQLSLGAGAPPLRPIDLTLGSAPNNGSRLFLGREPVGRNASLKSYGADRSRKAGSVSDDEIVRKVAAVLAADRNIDAKLDVHSRNGVVTVNGRVAGTGMIYRIIALIEKVDGVVGVDDQGLDVG